MINHNTLRDQIHASNVEAGWWSDLKTQTSILTTRNRPEMLCLIGSELIEAHTDGFEPDGHLPQYPAFHVEIADAAIRILDLAGADNIDLEHGHAQTVVGNPTNDLMTLLTLTVGYALEGYRKSDLTRYRMAIADAYATLFLIAEVYEFDLMEVIEAKAAYNKQRADHKIENRLAEGGKIC
jgi:hypothetical protein